ARRALAIDSARGRARDRYGREASSLPWPRRGAFGARVRAAGGPRRPTRACHVARAARGAALRLGRGDREQRGRGAHPRAAPQARPRAHQEPARPGLYARDRGLMSIRRRLLVWLLSCVLAGGLAAASVVFFQARSEVDEIFDY